jgi:PTS system nitrogen regulatory IIA component
MSAANPGPNLIELVGRGGVYYNLSGSSPEAVLSDLVATVPVPAGVDRGRLLAAILERESLMPTGVGAGIALPHPRNPLVDDPERQFVAVGFLEKPIDWRALDGKPVGTLVLIVSASPKLHLSTLSRVSFLCQQPSFRSLLADRASREELVAAIAAAERGWQ